MCKGILILVMYFGRRNCFDFVWKLFIYTYYNIFVTVLLTIIDVTN